MAEGRNNQIIEWIKENKLLTLILVLALILRIKYLTINQALWWDEAEYLSMAKAWAMNVPFDFHFVRPILWPLIATIQYSIGITSELPLRILQLISSLAGVYAIYLITKEFFNKNTALITAFISSVFYLQLFYTARLLVGLPSTTLWLFTIYFFWQWYKNNQSKDLYITTILLALAILLRLPAGLLAITIILFLLITKKLSWLKEKHVWYAGILGFLILLPYFIWFYIKFNMIPILGQAGYYTTTNQIPYYLEILPTILDTPLAKTNILLILLLLGTILLFYQAYKKQNKIQDNKVLIFLLLWAIPNIYYFGRLMIAEDRYLFYLYPVFFIIIAYTIYEIYKLTEKFHKTVAIAIVILILASTGYYHTTYADQLIESKAQSYKEFKEAGEWIKENSQPTDIIYCNGIPQNTYYSERETKRYPATEQEFIEQIKEQKPKYLVVTALEQAPEWSYTYTERNKIKPVAIWTADNKQPILVIYQL